MLDHRHRDYCISMRVAVKNEFKLGSTCMCYDCVRERRKHLIVHDKGDTIKVEPAKGTIVPAETYPLSSELADLTKSVKKWKDAYEVAESGNQIQCMVCKKVLGYTPIRGILNVKCDKCSGKPKKCGHPFRKLEMVSSSTQPNIEKACVEIIINCKCKKCGQSLTVIRPVCKYSDMETFYEATPEGGRTTYTLTIKGSDGIKFR